MVPLAICAAGFLETSVHAAAQDTQPQPVIQYRPKSGPAPVAGDADFYKKMSDIDNQILKLSKDRDGLRVKAESAAEMAESLLQQYHDELDLQQKYQQQMQTVDDQIAQLVRQKVDVSNRLKK